jgi:hypothetical protein
VDAPGGQRPLQGAHGRLVRVIPGLIASIVGYTIFGAWSGWTPIFGFLATHGARIASTVVACRLATPRPEIGPRRRIAATPSD